MLLIVLRRLFEYGCRTLIPYHGVVAKGKIKFILLKITKRTMPTADKPPYRICSGASPGIEGLSRLFARLP